MFRLLIGHVESSIERTDVVEFDENDEVELTLVVPIDVDEYEDDDEVVDKEADDED